jgi:hypothetical protein
MTIPPYARPWPPLADTNLAPLSRVESCKKDVLGWITVIVVLFGGALATLLGSAPGSLPENDGYLRTEDGRSRREAGATSPL